MELALAPNAELYMDVSLHDIATPALFKAAMSAFPFPDTLSLSDDDAMNDFVPDQDNNCTTATHVQAEYGRAFSSSASSMFGGEEEEEDNASLCSATETTTSSMTSTPAWTASRCRRQTKRSGPASTTAASSGLPPAEHVLPKEMAQKMKNHVIARGRRRAKQLATMSREEKVAEQLLVKEKNRMSAKECRQRKKAFIGNLEARISELEAADARNQAIIAQLQKLNASLLTDLRTLTQ